MIVIVLCSAGCFVDYLFLKSAKTKSDIMKDQCSAKAHSEEKQKMMKSSDNSTHKIAKQIKYELPIKPDFIDVMKTH